ncbi:endonuclease/exonuclease/phosphatase family protein [Methylobacterium sp. WL19]|uniref:endonuclease/exonuclease/phosphatase family protein n=1 Tax=Methylobacterium sp. WL19 TaxID=2603896 RepID=UPI0011C7F05C|nr:endonuclease/exonuclease/phosphatase family protein [Methylobacterium sp. WL19]TXN33530.1 endonuclease [Methylobacterium sp. WL19]
MIRRVLHVVTLSAAAVLVACTLLPLVPTDWWAVRLLDFPRLYWAIGLVGVGVGLLLFPSKARWVTGIAGAAVLMALVVNIAILWPYRPDVAGHMAACPADRRLSVLIANVQLGNRNAPGLLDAVRKADPDLFLAMETDAWWDGALDPLRERMPNVLKRITGSYYGIELYSRLPLVNGEIRHLAKRETPAIVAGVTMRTGETIDFIGLHPKPPLPWQSSLGRDAELYAAASILNERVEPGILAGDLNATPWEIAVERMRRLSGLVDPRHGYGYVATWIAGSSWLRWPLDQIFHEGGFETVSIERLDAFGSDHFPYLARLCRRTGASVDPVAPPDAGDVTAANATLAAAGAVEMIRLPTDR